MGIIDDYLRNIQEQKQQAAQQNTVLGYPSAAQPFPTVAQAYRDPSVSSIGSAQSLDDRYNPKTRDTEVDSTEKQTAQMQQAYIEAGNIASPNPVGQVVKTGLDVVKTGNQAYKAVNRAIAPELVTQVGPTYETMEAAISATKDPLAKEILADMWQNKISNEAITSGLLESGEGVAPALATEIGTGSMSEAGAETAALVSSLTGETLGSVAGTAVTSLSYAPYVAAAKILGTVTKGAGQAIEESVGGGAGKFLMATGEIASHAERGFLQPLQDEVMKNADITLDQYSDWANKLARSALNPAGSVLGAIEELLGTVVCTELYSQKRITKEVYEADAKFGKQMDRHEYEWYLSWARPLVKVMQSSKIISNVVSFFMAPVSKYMAGEMGVGNGSFFGKVNFKILQIICKIVGGKQCQQ